MWMITTTLCTRLSKYSQPSEHSNNIMFSRREAENNEDSKAGGQLLLNESMDHSSYTPTQFENSLGKLQVVTVKAPRQIIDVGVVRSTDSPVSHTAQQLHEGSPAPGAVVVEQGHK